VWGGQEVVSLGVNSEAAGMTNVHDITPMMPLLIHHKMQDLMARAKIQDAILCHFLALEHALLQQI